MNRNLRACLLVYSTLMAGVVVAGLAVSSGPTPIDSTVMRGIETTRSPGLTSVASLLTELFSPVAVPVWALGIAGYLLVHDRSVQRAATVLMSVAAAAVVAEAVKLIVGRPRPGAADQVSAYEASLSYPSGHVTAVAALLTGTAVVCAGSMRAGRIGAIVGALAVTLLAAWTRLYLGLHWLTDVGAGLVIGMATAALAAALVPPATALFAERAGHRIPGPRAGWLTPPRTRESHQGIGVPR